MIRSALNKLKAFDLTDNQIICFFLSNFSRNLIFPSRIRICLSVNITNVHSFDLHPRSSICTCCSYLAQFTENDYEILLYACVH